MNLTQNELELLKLLIILADPEKVSYARRYRRTESIGN